MWVNASSSRPCANGDEGRVHREVLQRCGLSLTELNHDILGTHTLYELRMAECDVPEWGRAVHHPTIVLAWLTEECPRNKRE